MPGPSAEAPAAPLSQAGSSTKDRKGAVPRTRSLPKDGSASAATDLVVTPKEVVLQAIEQGDRHSIRIAAKNVSKVTRRIRFIEPTGKGFTLAHGGTAAVAPGLELVADLELRPTEDRDYHDTMYVCIDNDRVEVPIHGYRSAPDIVFDGYMNFGMCPVGLTQVRYVELRNEGLRAGLFSFRHDAGLPVRIVPATDTIEPGRTARVKVEFTGGELGAFRTLVQVELDGHTPSKTLDLNANVVEQKVELAFPNGGGAVSNVYFGSLYFGQERVVEAFLINNGPLRCSFLASIAAPSASDGPSPTPDEPEAGPPTTFEDPCIAVSPVQGVLPPYSKVPVTFRFTPKEREVQKGFRSAGVQERTTEHYHAIAVLEVLEQPQQIKVDLGGKGMRPEVQVSEPSLRFGECPVNQRKDVALVVKNNSSELPFDFEMKRIANFRATPASGRLKPLQSQQLVVTFAPNQLGRFSGTMELSVCGGLRTVPVRVNGSASSEGPKPPARGGPLATDDDFRPQFNFIRAAEVPGGEASGAAAALAASIKKFRRPEPYESMEWVDAEPKPDGNPHGYSVQEYDAMKKHKAGYTNFVRDQRQARVDKATKASERRMDPTGVDLGMDPGDGLEEPVPRMPRVVEPLWMAQLSGEELMPRTKEHSVDENRLFKKKFKARPTTASEIRECKMQLSPKELAQISFGPKQLEFGTVCVHSSQAKSFTVTNPLKTHIIISIAAEAEELRKSGPESQVVPPGATAGFDIVFSSDVVQSFKKFVPYSINDQYTYKFTVTASVVPVSLKLSRDEMHFAFADDNMSPVVTDEVLISNPLNCKAEFKWFNKSPIFSAQPSEGYVDAFKSLPVTVSYRPVAVGRSEDVLILKVVGGPDVLLRCTGDLPEAKCIFIEKKLELGKFAVGFSKDGKCTVKNVGANEAVFWVDVNTPGVTVTPKIARVMPNARQDLLINVTSDQATLLEFPLLLNVRGGKPQKLPVSVEAILPQVRIEEDEIEFGPVYLGVTARQRVTLTNNSPVTAQLILDLTPYPEFSIVGLEIPPTPADGTRDGPAIEDDDMAIQQLSLLSAVSSASDLDSVRDEKRGDEIANAVAAALGEQGKQGLKYQLTLRGDRYLPFALVYTPAAVASHAFELPIAVTAAGPSAALRRVVGAEGVRPRLLLSASSVDFGSRIVLRDRVKKPPYAMEFQLTSNDGRRLQWDLEADKMPEAFKVEPSSGALEPGQTSTIRVLFAPREAGAYSASIPLFIDKAFDKVYVEVSISGTGNHPRLEFDRKEVVLPVVPLNVRSTATFYLVNQGYDNLELRYKLPADTARVPLALSFPEGALIGIAKERIPVEVSFTSRKAMSFTAKIDFFDSDGNKFSVPVTGTADNCVLTTYPYLFINEGHYDVVVREGRPVQLMDHLTEAAAAAARAAAAAGPNAKPAPAAPAAAAAAGGKDKGAGGERRARVVGAADHHAGGAINERTTKMLARFLNSSVLRQPISEIPGDMTSINGAPLLEVVESLSGKAFPNKPSRWSGNRKEAVQQLAQFYEDILTFLKSHGALLNAVRPEYLLSYEDYVKLQQVKEQKAREAAGAAAAADASAAVGGPSDAQSVLGGEDRDGAESARAPSTVGQHNGGGGGTGSRPVTTARRAHHSEKRFAVLAREAWVAVLFQAIKVFALGRVTPKQLRTLPGMDIDESSAAYNLATGVGSLTAPTPTPTVGGATTPAPSQAPEKAKKAAADPMLTGSNLYGVGESVLLRWLSLHFAKVNPGQARRLASFDGDLRDGTALAALLLSHVPQFLKLRQVKHGSKDPGDWEANAERVVAALRDLRLDFQIAAQDITEGAPREMLLYVLYLYNHLPQFVPKTTIDFNARLSERVVRSIELTNPSKKPVTYGVRLTEGAADFAIHDETIRLEPQGTAALPIEFAARFSRPVSGRVVLSSVRAPGCAPASTMVFLLQGIVQSRKAQSSARLEAKVYEARPVEIQVANPFAGDCEFQITMIQERVPDEIAALLPAAASGGASGSGPGAASGAKTHRAGAGDKTHRGGNAAGAAPGPPAPFVFPEPTPQTAGAAARSLAGLPDPFYVKPARLRLREGESTSLVVTFLPFAMGTYRCQILFLDEKVGEMMHEVIGTGLLPDAGETLRPRCEAGGTATVEVVIPAKNPVLDRARQAALDLAKAGMAARGIKDMKEKDVLKKLAVSAEPELADYTYKVEFTSSYYSAPDPLLLHAALPPGKDADRPAEAAKGAGRGGAKGGPPPKPSGGGERGRGGENTKLPVQFHPKAAGVYPAKLVLRSPIDVRVYDVEGTAVSTGSRVQLEFAACARQAIVQDIPIVNASDKEFRVSATVQGQYFSGPREIAVPPKTTVQYPLSYRPLWAGESAGELTLTNQNSGEKHVYELKGVADEPLAEEHVIIECQARRPTTHTFRVYNILPPPAKDAPAPAEVPYRVESDVAMVSGEGTVRVPGPAAAAAAKGGPVGEAEYELTVRPTRAGTFAGSITFIAPNGWYIWYTVELRAQDPPAERTIELRTALRKAVAVDIAITNPRADGPVEFEVLAEGDGLLGDPIFIVPPASTASYELIFSPLVAGARRGSITFLNERAGQFWFELALVGEPPLPVLLPELRAELGSVASHEVTLENPIGEAISLRVHSTNDRNFRVQPSPVPLGPYEAATVAVQYTPSSLGEIETAEVTFSHPAVGDWAYSCSGQGLHPTQQPPIEVAATLGLTSTSTIVFRNPFPRPLPVSVRLLPADAPEEEGPPPPGPFALLLKRTARLALPALALLQIPIAFLPERMADHACTVIVEAEADAAPGPPLRWVYPVRGVAEAVAPGAAARYRCRARTRVEEVLEVRLSGLAGLSPAALAREAFASEVVYPREAGPLLRRALSVVPLDARPAGPDAAMRFQVVFEPLKALKASAELVVAKASGGRWRFELGLEATAPDVDDVIVIEGALGKRASVSFRLTNTLAAPAPFIASFTPESPPEFSVAPSAGTLEPHGGAGTAFVVSFAASEYGKPLVGRLVIETDEMAWSYEVRGTHPAYQPPAGQSRVDRTLPADVEARLLSRPERPRNFLRENLQRPIAPKGRGAAPAPGGASPAGPARR